VTRREGAVARKQADVESCGRWQEGGPVDLTTEDVRDALAGCTAVPLTATPSHVHQSKSGLRGGEAGSARSSIRDLRIGNDDRIRLPRYSRSTSRERGLAGPTHHGEATSGELTGITAIKGGRSRCYAATAGGGWPAGRGGGAAAVLRDGPDKHGGKDYWLSTRADGRKRLV